MEVKRMEDKKDTYECAHCGFTAEGKFRGDICPECGLTYWKCSKCGYLVTVASPPDTCPSCNEKCEFLNVTCYTPECGGPGKIDPRLG
jgi:rubrerythrin